MKSLSSRPQQQVAKAKWNEGELSVRDSLSGHAFLLFLFYGNVAPGIVLLALGVIFVVNGGRHRSYENKGLSDNAN